MSEADSIRVAVLVAAGSLIAWALSMAAMAGLQRQLDQHRREIEELRDRITPQAHQYESDQSRIAAREWLAAWSKRQFPTVK